MTFSRKKTIFLARRLAAGGFFGPKNTFLWEKNNFPRLAACRRRLFFWSKITFWAKNYIFKSKIAFWDQNDISLFKNCAFFAILACLKQKQPFFTPRCSSPYRIVTNPYTPNIELCQLFFNTFILYGFCLYFNFSSMPSL